MTVKMVIVNEETVRRVDSIQIREHPFREMVAIEFAKNTSNHPVGAMFEVGLDEAYEIGLAIIQAADVVKMRGKARRKMPEQDAE